MDDRKCKNCAFWLQQAATDLTGQCRRFPPHLPQNEQQQRSMEATGAGPFVGVWPDTLGIDWCGEHQPRQYVRQEDPLSILKLSGRTASVLARAGIHTVGDLVGRSVQDLMTIRHFGAACLKEVRERIDANGLQLKDI